MLRPSATSTGEEPRSFPLPSYSLAATTLGRVCILLLYLPRAGYPVRVHAFPRRTSIQSIGIFIAPAAIARRRAARRASFCEAGTFCHMDCAKGYANFDEAKGCANAAKGYCCKDTKPANYPFKPAA